MTEPGEWVDVGAAEDFKRAPLREAKLGERLVAVSFKDGKFGVISNVCNHVGGPLGKGRLDGEFVVCPWHQYKFHRCTGEGEPGYEADKVPGYGVKEENGRLLVTAKPTSKRGHLPHEPHPLTRSTDRAPGGLRVGGISTTAMDAKNPRFSTSEHLLQRGARACRIGARRGNEADQAQRSQLPQLRGLLLQGGQGLHLAVLGHLHGPDRPARPGVRNGRALGRHPAGRDADPLGRRELALLQDGRAHELHPEPDHVKQQACSSGTRWRRSSSPAGRTASRPWPAR